LINRPFHRSTKDAASIRMKPARQTISTLAACNALSSAMPYASRLVKSRWFTIAVGDTARSREFQPGRVRLIGNDEDDLGRVIRRLGRLDQGAHIGAAP
jgi:hypothetical protein